MQMITLLGAGVAHMAAVSCAMICGVAAADLSNLRNTKTARRNAVLYGFAAIAFLVIGFALGAL